MFEKRIRRLPTNMKLSKAKIKNIWMRKIKNEFPHFTKAEVMKMLFYFGIIRK